MEKKGISVIVLTALWALASASLVITGTVLGALAAPTGVMPPAVVWIGAALLAVSAVGGVGLLLLRRHLRG